MLCITQNNPVALTFVIAQQDPQKDMSFVARHAAQQDDTQTWRHFARCTTCVTPMLTLLNVQEEEALQLVDHMLELDALPQLVYRLRQFNESVPEEAEATQKLLSVFENLIEVKPEVAEQLVQHGDNKTGFLRSAVFCCKACVACIIMCALCEPS